MSTKLTIPEADTLQEVIGEIARLHNDILASARTSLEKAMRIGELLTSIKAGLKHGQWLPWLAEHAPFTDRTARNYIRVFEERDRIKSASVSDLSEAYHLLGDCSGVINIYDEAAFLEALTQTWARFAEFDKDLRSDNVSFQRVVEIKREAQELERVWHRATLECERELGRWLIEMERKGYTLDEINAEIKRLAEVRAVG